MSKDKGGNILHLISNRKIEKLNVILKYLKIYLTMICSSRESIATMLSKYVLQKKR